MKNSELLSENSNLKIWNDDSKRIMEFANLVMTLYGQKYSVISDWFSNDAKFNEQIDAYNQQKIEIKEIVHAFRGPSEDK